MGNATQKEIFRSLLIGNYATDHAGRTMIEYFLDLWSKCNRLEFYKSDQEFIEDISRYFSGDLATFLNNIATIGGSIDRVIDELTKAEHNRRKPNTITYNNVQKPGNLYNQNTANPSFQQASRIPSTEKQPLSRTNSNNNNNNTNNYNHNRNRPNYRQNSRMVTVDREEVDESAEITIENGSTFDLPQ
jgi:hypothetical protein